MTHPHHQNWLGLILGLLVMSCSWADSGSEGLSPSNGVQDFSNTKQPRHSSTLMEFMQGKRNKLRLLQIGDSHTAGDFFSNQVRTRLQAQYGNGGIGWIYPGQVAGQRMAQVSYQMRQWSTITSRMSTADFPAGGVIAQNQAAGGELSVSPRSPVGGMQNVTFWLKPENAEQPLMIGDALGNRYALNVDTHRHEWQRVTVPVSLPLTFAAEGEDRWQVGGINIENAQKGVVYSAMGINGAQLTQTQRWRAQWPDDVASLQPDVILLAYGTNEAFNDQPDVAALKAAWLHTIDQLQKQLPNSLIVIIGAPESLKSLSGECGVRPPSLSLVQQAQREIAQQAHVLYWDWQAAMGGACSMKSWVAQGLGRADGVHFSAAGYERAANVLAQGLIDYFNVQK